MMVIDWNIVFSNLLGGVIALVVALVVSRWELRRRERKNEKNWYRRVRLLAVRSYTSKGRMFFTDNEQREIIARTYKASGEQLQELIADPYADTDPKLYSAIQQLVFYLNGLVETLAEKQDG